MTRINTTYVRLSLRDFLGLPTDKAPPDHSTISRTRRLIDQETHRGNVPPVALRLQAKK